MFGLAGGVHLTELGPRDGLMRGRCGGIIWEARMARGPVSYGLEPQSLYKGQGRIVRLVLYEALAAGTLRKVAAFDRGWQFGRKEHVGVVQRVVRFLERH